MPKKANLEDLDELRKRPGKIGQQSLIASRIHVQRRIDYMWKQPKNKSKSYYLFCTFYKIQLQFLDFVIWHGVIIFLMQSLFVFGISLLLVIVYPNKLFLKGYFAPKTM